MAANFAARHLYGSLTPTGPMSRWSSLVDHDPGR